MNAPDFTSMPWHRYQGTGPRCTYCGALPDRAIHDKRYAELGGYEFVETPDEAQREHS